MAWEARLGLKPLIPLQLHKVKMRLNGLGSPFGIETDRHHFSRVLF